MNLRVNNFKWVCEEVRCGTENHSSVEDWSGSMIEGGQIQKVKCVSCNAEYTIIIRIFVI